MSCELSAISYAYPACPVALEDGTGVEYLPSEMCNLFHRGFTGVSPEMSLPGWIYASDSEAYSTGELWAIRFLPPSFQAL